ncbi:MAG: type II toxin-antitoxin system RelE/ParE family toxin [Candidatus Aenigmarchaeota archaeon]|nr:type II toxin-antitoxin system RelE/ParE family toxin [Candidatus Aenigmarchaeota archaeon]
MISYSYEIGEKLNEKLKKLARKNKNLYDSVQKQIIKIASNPQLGKPLRYNLKGKLRVHIGHFVLVYEINENELKIIFTELEHHDKAYAR